MAEEDLPSEPLDELIGTSLGAYRIVERIGRGGMGLIYLAVRDDETFQKRVAIKVLKPGMDSEDVLRRFRAERQILASLAHANIAQLLDGGSTPRGLPFLVMEFVEGKPFHRYCDELRLSVESRLTLFLDVVGAVHFAHQNLIVHRDLKPGNILVTVEGVTKLLDFGIAKLLNPELSGLTLMPTALAAAPMTPEYASPEQLRGEHVGTASDVYALGVLLYEILTGGHPHRTTTPGTPGGVGREVTRAILDEEPALPSVAVRTRREEHSYDGRSRVLLPEGVAALRDEEPERLARRLRGDLDNIVLRALAKEPARRYASAFELAEDLRRYLEGQPVSARPATLRYRAGKFVGRHRLGVGIAASLVLGLIVTSVVISLLAVRLARERDRAEQEAARAEVVTRFVTELFTASDPSQSRWDKSARELLDAGVERLDAGLSDQPLVRADLMNAAGTIYRRLGHLARAQPLLEGALEVRRQLLGGEHAKVAESLNELAILHESKAEWQRAETYYREALALRRRVFGDRSLEVADTLDDYSVLLINLSEFARAQEALLEARSILEATPARRSAEMASVLTNLGVVQGSSGLYAECLASFREALAIRRAVHGDDHLEVAASYENLGLVELGSGHPREAESLQRQALEMNLRLLPPTHPSLARNHINLGLALELQGRFEEAEGHQRAALEQLRQLQADDRPMIATVLQNLGTLALERGDLEMARRQQLEALEMRRRLFEGDHVEVADSLVALAKVEAAAKEIEAAGVRMREALELRRRAYGAEDLEVAATRVDLAEVLLAGGDPFAAESELAAALASYGRRQPAAAWTLTRARVLRALCRLAQGRLDEAEPLLVEGIGALEAQLGERSPPTRAALALAVGIYERLGRADEAARWRARLAR